VKTTFCKVKGHSGIEGTDGADKLAGEGALKLTPDNIKTETLSGDNLIILISFLFPLFILLHCDVWRLIAYF